MTRTGMDLSELMEAPCMGVSLSVAPGPGAVRQQAQRAYGATKGGVHLRDGQQPWLPGRSAPSHRRCRWPSLSSEHPIRQSGSWLAPCAGCLWLLHMDQVHHIRSKRSTCPNAALRNGAQVACPIGPWRWPGDAVVGFRPLTAVRSKMSGSPARQATRARSVQPWAASKPARSAAVGRTPRQGERPMKSGICGLS